MILPEDAWEGPTEIVKERLGVPGEDQYLKPSKGRQLTPLHVRVPQFTPGTPKGMLFC